MWSDLIAQAKMTMMCHDTDEHERALAEARAVAGRELKREVDAGRSPSESELASNPGLRIAMGLDEVWDDWMAGRSWAHD